MNKQKFLQQAYANPAQPSQAVLDAARANPGYQRMLDQIQALEREIHSVVNAASVPRALKQKLLALPDESEAVATVDESFVESSVADYKDWNFLSRQKLGVGLAACLLLTIGIFFIHSENRGLSPAEVALGDLVLNHLYEYDALFAAMRSDTLEADYALPAINQVLSPTGFRVSGNDFMRNMPVRYVNPCDFLPAHQAAHLMLQSGTGAVNVIITNNQPVRQEFGIQDGRFAGVVIPLESGNLILVAERSQPLTPYRDGIRRNLERLI